MTKTPLKESRTNISALAERDAPINMSAEEFRRLGYSLVDSLASLFDSFADRPVAAGTTPSGIRQMLGTAGLPEDGQDPETVLKSATQLLFDTSTFNGHPKFLGFITAPASPIGVLGEFLAAGVNANVGAWSLSPSATEIERQALRWVAELIGFPVNSGGVFVSGGNMANLVCIFAARHAVISAVPENQREGIQNRLRLYASIETHTWIDKAVEFLGLASNSVRRIGVDERGRIRTDLLQSALDADIERGDLPIAVIGNAGTTNTGAIDSLNEIARMCRDRKVWFHVDGAYGAPAAVVRNAHPDLSAISDAHSVSVDPHKWLYAPLEAGCAFVRDETILRDTFSHHPPYFHFADPEGEPVFNFHEYGPQNSRGFRALKVWLALRQVGRSGYVKMIEDDISLAQLLHERVSANEYLRPVSCELSIVTFAFVPPDLASGEHGEYLDQLNTELLSALQEDGSVYMSNAVVDGRFLLRACVVNFRTSAADIVEVVDLVVKAGMELDSKLRPASAT
jgi:glutamate/tyrosine decarboxylase-like PLP-dependent enzyme